MTCTLEHGKQSTAANWPRQAKATRRPVRSCEFLRNHLRFARAAALVIRISRGVYEFDLPEATHNSLERLLVSSVRQVTDTDDTAWPLVPMRILSGPMKPFNPVWGWRRRRRGGRLGLKILCTPGILHQKLYELRRVLRSAPFRLFRVVRVCPLAGESMVS